MQGFDFGGTYYVDSRVQFGLRMAPELAHRFTMFLKRLLHANGVHAVVGVMDDNLFFHCEYQACFVMLAVAMALLFDLGFLVNMKPGKTVLPAEVQKFVGLVINSARMTLSLPEKKLAELVRDIIVARGSRTILRKQLQRLVGKLQWASKAVCGGRVFIRACIDGLSTVHHPGQEVNVTSHMRSDLDWWLTSASVHNGLLVLGSRQVTHYACTDACLSPAPYLRAFSAGAFFSLGSAALSAQGFSPPAVEADINVWECYAVLVVVSLLGDCWSGSRVVVFSDNAASVMVGLWCPPPCGCSHHCARAVSVVHPIPHPPVCSAHIWGGECTG